VQFCFAIFRVLTKRGNQVQVVYLLSDEALVILLISTTHNSSNLHRVQHIKPPHNLMSIGEVLRQIITDALFALDH
jgi:hypothetical protein